MNLRNRFDGIVCRRKAILGALSVPCFLGKNANALDFFGPKKDNFKSEFDSCMGVPMAQFVNSKLRAFDKSDLDIRMAYPLVIDGRLPIIICSVDDGGDIASYDLMTGMIASKGYLVILIMPSNVAVPVSRIANNTRRAQQVRFTLDKVQDLIAPISQIRQKVDFNAIGIAGHGDGAWTALELVGWNRELLPNSDLADGRIRGAFSLMPTQLRHKDTGDTEMGRQIIYGRTMIAGDLDSIPEPPTGSGIIGLNLPSKSTGFGGLIGRLRGKKRDEKPQREILAASCVAAGYFFDWSLKSKKERYNDIISLNGKEIPEIGKKLRVVRA